MCFSAGASFAAGTILSVIGISALKKVQQPSHTLFAAIPLFFAAQQITEGFLWLSLNKPEFEFLRQSATYSFLFFAQVLWPIWVPLSILLLEKKIHRTTIQKLLVGVGAIVSLFLAYCLVMYPVEANAIGGHISYGQEYPAGLTRYGAALYMVATIAPPFVSGLKRMWAVGSCILVSYIATAIFYKDHVLSVWCFFAAVISIVIFSVLLKFKTMEKDKVNFIFSGRKN